MIDKPAGLTSFDVIRRLRRQRGVKKMGHAGTLDPLATGLMIIGLGEGTKKLHEYLKLPKVYEAQVLLGKKTTTGDLAGEITQEINNAEKLIEIKKLKSVLAGLVGWLHLPVPVYSAVKVKGQPLYKRARRGEAVTAPHKKMAIHALKLKSHYPAPPYYICELELAVASGTYIRSIAEEIGRRLGVPATLKSLRRTKIGPFNIKDARPLNNASVRIGHGKT